MRTQPHLGLSFTIRRINPTTSSFETRPAGPTESSERRPFLPNEFPMPPKHRFRMHQHRAQRGSAHESAQGSHDCSICRLESRRLT